MTVYAVAQLTILDRARYDRYMHAFLPVLRQYGGRLLAADEHPEVAEGQWAGDKVVLISFDNRDAYLTWAHSPEYRTIVRDRLAAAETVVLLVRGIAG